jgi:hypothetical protein
MTETLTRPAEALADLAAGLRASAIIPYLGPGISALAEQAAPLSPEALAAFFETKVALPKRARGNAWAAAQHIESYRHRSTVTALMAEAFATPVEPSPFHRALAALGLPLIIDSWYAGEMRQALAGRDDWAEVQGITRAGIGEFLWYRFYPPDGLETAAATAQTARTILYTPHGGVRPAQNFLISDADYVEVLTEIDIQTPIPEVVRDRRTDRGFLFVGCRFNDQLLRSYAKQIIKRSGGSHHAIVDLAALTRNERAFLDTHDIHPIDMPLGAALDALIAG